MKKIIFLTPLILSSIFLYSQNVGIGTTTPANKLQIGNTPGFTGNHLAIGNGIQGMSFNQYPSTSTWYSSTGFSLMPNGGNGYVGVGTIVPAYNFDVHGTGNAQFNLTEGIGGQTALFSRYTNRMEIQPSDFFEISVGGIDHRNLCVANNGYVGIETSTPTNLLQVGSYINSNFGGNQIAYGFGTNVTVMNQYASLSNFQSTSALNIQAAHDIYLMPTNGNGHVGINTNTPEYALDVNGSVYIQASSGPALTIYGGSPYTQPSGSNSLTNCSGFCGSDGFSILAGDPIQALGFYATSDARLKDIKDISNSLNDLLTLNAIKITDYTLKDKRMSGDKIYKKVIALR